MRTIRPSALLLLALLPLGSCDDSTEPEVAERFVAQLTGTAEVPPRTTTASGSASFELSRDRDEIRYELTATSLNNYIQAHIHMAPAGENGSIVVFLFGPHGNPGISMPTVVKSGTITAADLNPSSFTGTLEDLVTAMRAGQLYVNAHTVAFPGGEIRGQIATAP